MAIPNYVISTWSSILKKRFYIDSDFGLVSGKIITFSIFDMKHNASRTYSVGNGNFFISHTIEEEIFVTRFTISFDTDDKTLEETLPVIYDIYNKYNDIIALYAYAYEIDLNVNIGKYIPTDDITQILDLFSGYNSSMIYYMDCLASLWNDSYLSIGG